MRTLRSFFPRYGRFPSFNVTIYISPRWRLQTAGQMWLRIAHRRFIIDRICILNNLISETRNEPNARGWYLYSFRLADRSPKIAKRSAPSFWNTRFIHFRFDDTLKICRRSLRKCDSTFESSMWVMRGGVSSYMWCLWETNRHHIIRCVKAGQSSKGYIIH